MTKQEFIDNFFIQYDQISRLAAPGIDLPELSKIVSKVQEDLVILTYDPKGNKLGDGFEETEKRIQDLGELVRYKNFTSFSNGFFDNSVTITLPNTLITNGSTDFSDVFWFSIYEEVVTNKQDCNFKDTEVFVKATVADVVHNELSGVLSDPFKKPYFKNNEARVLRLRSENRIHTLITDGNFKIKTYKLGYIRKPQPIDLTTNLTNKLSELSDHKERELLEKTVEYVLKITQQTQQLMVEQQQNKE